LTREINPRAEDSRSPVDQSVAMSTIDYILGAAALALVLWNMRRHELTDRRLRRPLIIAAAIGIAFLHGVPTTGADGVLVALGVLVGIGCGMTGGLATRLDRDDAGATIATATPLAVTVTVLAFAGRLGFAFAATHGLGPAIARFSSEVGVHSQQAWVAALVLMAVADLAVRALILWQRRDHAARWSPALRAA
jgi:hypothetical protein